MRIVFFSHYYPPEVNAPASRTSEHCRVWARQGHEVTVVTCAPNHPSGKIYPGYRNRLYQSETIDGVRVIRLWTLLAANDGFLLRTLNYVSYFVSAALLMSFLPKADVVVSTSPQFFCGLVGLVARVVKRAPWVLEVRDLWPESIVTVGAMNKGAVIRFLEAVEALAYRRAERIVSVTDSFVPHIGARGGAGKIEVIKNGVDLELFTRSADGGAAKRRFGLDGRFVAAYVGTHGLAHGLDTALDAAALLRDDPRMGFLLVGDGAERKRLLARAEEMELDNLRMVGQLPKAEMPSVWAATDASLILLRKRDAFKKVIPSKVFEAMAMGCPILLGVEGESKDLLEEAGAGMAITPESAEELAAAVMTLAQDHELAARLGCQGAAHVREHFAREKLALHYLGLLEEIVRCRERKVSMSAAAVFEKAKRTFAFARYMPLSKLARRVELNLRRRLRDRLPSFARPLALATPARAQISPGLIFAPRAELAPKRMGNRWNFEFLAHAVEMTSPRIDWGAPGPGAAHQLWRMNLHYMEYLEGVDDDAWATLVEDWIEANPASRSGVWRDSWNSYVLSLRVVVWLQELARRGNRLPAATRARVEVSAVEQLAFLESNLETDLGGNHLVKNIKALVWASAYFAGAEAERWRATGLRHLKREIAEQILSDGTHYECSPSYHCQVFADLLECRHALGGDPFGGALDEALARMAQVVADLAHPDGDVTLFNDAGLTMAYSPGKCLEAYARLFGALPERRRIFAFSRAGYYGLRAGENYLVVDCGRIAPDDLPAHGHGDVLSFEWSASGQRIVVDQGVFEYTAGERRQIARAAMSHNTLCFDGADQADFFGAFRCGRRPNVETRRWEPGVEGLLLEGSHDGFTHLPGRPRHVRRIEVDAASIDIIDRIEGRADRKARVNFLLHPEVVVERGASGIELRRSAVRIAFSASSPVEIVPALWWPDMGREHPTSRIVIALAPGDTESRASFRIVSGEARA